MTHQATCCFHSVSRADDFSRWSQDDVSSAGRREEEPLHALKNLSASHVSVCTAQELHVTHRCVVPLPWQVFWLRWVGHPGRATVRGWRWHDKVIWVTRTVGWYSVDCCYWVSCEINIDLTNDWTSLIKATIWAPRYHTWVGGDGLVDGDSRERCPGQWQVGGAVVLLGLQLWGLWHTRLQTDIRGGTVSAEQGQMLSWCTVIKQQVNKCNTTLVEYSSF